MSLQYPKDIPDFFVEGTNLYLRDAKRETLFIVRSQRLTRDVPIGHVVDWLKDDPTIVVNVNSDGIGGMKLSEMILLINLIRGMKLYYSEDKNSVTI